MKIKMTGTKLYPTALTYLPSKFEEALEGKYIPFPKEVPSSSRLNSLLISLSTYVRIIINNEKPSLEMAELVNSELANAVITFTTDDDIKFFRVSDEFCNEVIEDTPAYISQAAATLKLAYNLNVDIAKAEENITAVPFYHLVHTLLIETALLSSHGELSLKTNHLKTVEGKL